LILLLCWVTAVKRLLFKLDERKLPAMQNVKVVLCAAGWTVGACFWACDEAIYSAAVVPADAASPQDVEPDAGQTRDAAPVGDSGELGDGPGNDGGQVSDARPACNTGWAEGRFANSLAGSASQLTWKNAGLARGLDGEGATTVGRLLQAQETSYLAVGDFGLQLARDVVISGIEVEVTRKSSGGLGIRDLSVQLYQSEFSKADRRNSGLLWALAPSTVTYGAANDLWGETWSPARVNDPDFSVMLAATNTAAVGGDSPIVDQIRVRVNWICP
jgi:hypothetical protein